MNRDEIAFAPWKRDYSSAGKYMLFGALWLALGCAWIHVDTTFFSVSFTLVSVALFYQGFERYEHGKKRKFGIKIEKGAVDHFKRLVPQGWEVKEDLMMARKGNIDLCVRLPNREMCTIEIKSWQTKAYSKRTMRAFYQTLVQKDDMNAKHALLWLPQSRSNKITGLKGSEVVVVEGGAPLLVKALQRFNSNGYLIKFKNKPNEEVRDIMKRRGFRWDNARICWVGNSTDDEMVELTKQVTKAGGTIVPQGRLK